MTTKKHYLADVLAGIDDAGKAVKAKLDELWVPWDESAGAGAVHWHAAAAAHLRTALVDLADLRERLTAVSWPDAEQKAAQAEHDRHMAVAQAEATGTESVIVPEPNPQPPPFNAEPLAPPAPKPAAKPAPRRRPVAKKATPAKSEASKK